MECRYDQVFDEKSSQADVYSFVKPALSDLVHGVNTTVFAYGQTGTGISVSKKDRTVTLTRIADEAAQGRRIQC